MRFWVDKEQEKKPDGEWKDAYVFSINRKQYSTIFTNITNSWYRMDQMQIPAIYEDLFIIGLSIFALDKRVSRRRFKNCWTRDINVSIPVLEYDKWKDTGLQWEKMLGFLTGDHWHIVFRKSEVIYSYREHANRIHLNVQDCDCVCLFSGGLDSFCGAIRLLEEGGSPCLVGHNEYPKLAKRQNLFVRTFQDLYPEQSVKFISFTANSRAPISEKEGILKGSENTSRGRSLLFLCAALSVAGILGENVPVYIPENGFIGLNIPLTGGRKGTCSTRTTHPYFLRQFNGILEQVGIKNTITNFFAYNTKREIVGQVKDTDAFKSCYADTISCSHPCLARYNKKGSKEYPVNCGYCYPCLIRKSSLLDIDEIKKYSYQGEAYDFLIEYEESEKSADLRAVLGSIYRCKHSSDKELKRYIRCVGELTEEEVEKFLSLYKKSIEDIDTHFHLDYYKEHQKIYDGINERKQYTLCMTNSPGVYISCKRIYPETKYLKFALGFHPQDVSLKDADFYDFMQLVNTTNYVGEIGLDFSRQSYISRNKQCMYFEQIVRVCAEKDKLMSVHLRRAEEEAISILKKYRPRRCIIHWFNGNGEQLQQLVDIGCYFSLNSNMVTNEKNKEKLYLIPKTRVLIESDGPFTKIDGKKYTFNNLIKIYELVARYYNEPDIIKMVYANFRDILSK